MNKKAYQKPTMRIVRIQHQQIICTSLYSINSGDTGLGFGGGGSGPAHARGFGGWDDDWDE